MATDVSLGPVLAAPPLAATGRSAAPPLRLLGSGSDDAAAGNAVPHPAATAPDVLNRAAQRVADALGSGNSFRFAVDRQTGIMIVRVINRATGELVRQIPTEEVVHIAQLLQQDEHLPVLDVRV